MEILMAPAPRPGTKRGPAKPRGDGARAQEWRAVAQEIHADVLANGLPNRGHLLERHTHRPPRLQDLAVFG